VCACVCVCVCVCVSPLYPEIVLPSRLDPTEVQSLSAHSDATFLLISRSCDTNQMSNMGHIHSMRVFSIRLVSAHPEATLLLISRSCDRNHMRYVGHISSMRVS